MNASRKLPTWREMNLDTTPEIEAVLFKMWRETPAWRKLQMLESLNKSARQLSLIGLKQRHPNASVEELQRRLADMTLGSVLATRAYGPLVVE
jgi:hypothetical protein